MQLGQFFAKLLKSTPVRETEPVQAALAAPAQQQANRSTENELVTMLGVKYTCRYSWQIVPPAGWQRQESGLDGSWPFSGVSPFVSFKSMTLPTGEKAMIRWQLSGTPVDRESHDLLERLLSGQAPLTASSVRRLTAPGLVTSMKITAVDRLTLSGGLPAIEITARYLDLKGEEPLLRSVLILPDRVMNVKGERSFFRETIQYVATESSFAANEPLSLASIETFRRNDANKTADEKGFVSGAFPVTAGSQL
jgi:hypothetical protein